MSDFDPRGFLDELYQLPELCPEEKERARKWYNREGETYHYHTSSLFRMTDGLPGDFLSHGRAVPV